MDKELVERIRCTLESINDSVMEINNYLTQLRKQTDEEIASLARRTLAAQAAARVQPPADMFAAYAADVPSPDPRRPYTAGRQPRRDGDSFGRLQKPAQGGAHGKTSPDTK